MRGGGGTGGRRHRRLALVAAGVVVALGLAAAGWWATADAAADRVSASWSPTCGGRILDTSGIQPVIRSRPHWRCVVTVTVRNDSDRVVRVSHLELPLMGSGGGAEVTAYATGRTRILDVDKAPRSTVSWFGNDDWADDDVDAVVMVDVKIPPHTTRNVSFRIGRNPHGCNSGGVLTIDHWVTVAFHTMHRTFRDHVDQTLTLRTYNDALDATLCKQD